jgi:hypothetical protein
VFLFKNNYAENIAYNKKKYYTLEDGVHHWVKGKSTRNE